jgi:hypothetical protein
MWRVLLRLISRAMFWLPPVRLVKITVWHRMTVIGTITDEPTLAAFEKIWSQKIKQPKATKPKYRYSSDLGTLRGTKYRSTRWVYNLDGMTKVMVIPDLGLFRNPVYRVPAVDDLNRLVGIVVTQNAEVATPLTHTPAGIAR